MDCVRMCHMLKTVTERREEDDVSGPSDKQIEDFGRCVDRTQSSSLTITSDFRIVRHIESAVDERAGCAANLREHHPWSTEEHLIQWRTEMLEILRYFDVRGPQLAVPTVSNLPQEDLQPGSALEVKQHVDGTAHADSSAPASVKVCFCLPPPRHPLPTICQT